MINEQPEQVIVKDLSNSIMSDLDKAAESGDVHSSLICY